MTDPFTMAHQFTVQQAMTMQTAAMQQQAIAARNATDGSQEGNAEGRPGTARRLMTAGGRVKTVLRFAAEHGIRVHAAHLENGVLGEWYADTREIYYDITLTPDEAVGTIAHELGHAHHGHRCEDIPSDERQADEYAAALLINPQRLAHLERLGLSKHDIAEELRVSEELLDVFLGRWITRLRGVAYVRSRMGAGAWTHRIEVA